MAMWIVVWNDCSGGPSCPVERLVEEYADYNEALRAFKAYSAEYFALVVKN